MIEWLANPQILDLMALFVTLTLLEIVLGVDNIIFLVLITQRLPEHQQSMARKIGLALALIFRIVLLFSIALIIAMKDPVLHIMGLAFSWRDIILIGGGLFLIFKGTQEIHKSIEEDEEANRVKLGASHGLMFTIAQIALIDLVFSIDSIITAIGLAAEHLWLMVSAVVIAIFVMYFTAEGIAGFIKRHPTIKMLALAFLIMIGTVLIADGFGVHIDRGYIYTAMAFSIIVEFLNMLMRRKKRKKSNA